MPRHGYFWNKLSFKSHNIANYNYKLLAIDD